MAHVVGCRSLIQQACVRSQAIPCEIYDRQNGSGVVRSACCRFHLQIHTARSATSSGHATNNRLFTHAVRRPDATFTNISPLRLHTSPLQTVQILLLPHRTQLKCFLWSTLPGSGKTFSFLQSFHPGAGTPQASNSPDRGF